MGRDEVASLTYIDWQESYITEKPYQIFSAIPDSLSSLSSTNLVFKDGAPEAITDVRGVEHTFDLATQGFQFCRHSLGALRLEDVDEVERRYLPELEALLKREISGADRVFFFDWRIRKNLEIHQPVIDANDKMQYLLPARHVHIDQAPSAVLGRVQLHLPGEAADLLRGRVRVINIWRPLVDVVQDRPLVFCDIRTIQSHDLVEADHIRKHYNGSNYYARPSTAYKWYYLSEQTKDEVTLLQMFDSAHHGNSGEFNKSNCVLSEPSEPPDECYERFTSHIIRPQ